MAIDLARWFGFFLIFLGLGLITWVIIFYVHTKQGTQGRHRD